MLERVEEMGWDAVSLYDLVWVLLEGGGGGLVFISLISASFSFYSA